MGKLLICVKNGVLNGRQLYDLLREKYHLQMEMAAERYVLAIMTIMDTEEGWQRLAAALLEIDDRIERGAVTITARPAETGVTAAHIPENRTEQPVQKKKNRKRKKQDRRRPKPILESGRKCRLMVPRAEWQLILSICIHRGYR